MGRHSLTQNSSFIQTAMSTVCSVVNDPFVITAALAYCTLGAIHYCTIPTRSCYTPPTIKDVDEARTRCMEQTAEIVTGVAYAMTWPLSKWVVQGYGIAKNAVVNATTSTPPHCNCRRCKKFSRNDPEGATESLKVL
jgi:hypothetical protein